MTARLAQNTETQYNRLDGHQWGPDAAEGGEASGETVAARSNRPEDHIIDDIGVPTNLLALNAAIEAARARASARAFLSSHRIAQAADRSQVAAQESARWPRASWSSSRKAGTFWREMAESHKKSSDLVQEISAASQESFRRLWPINLRGHPSFEPDDAASRLVVEELAATTGREMAGLPSSSPTTRSSSAGTSAVAPGRRCARRRSRECGLAS